MLKIFLIVTSITFYLTAETLQEQKEDLFKKLETKLELNATELNSVKKIFKKGSTISQGNPAVTKHPITRDQCVNKLKNAGVSYENEKFKEICKSPYMAPLYNPKSQKASDAKVCIDQFEFPNIPCEYPVVWVRTSEAHQICQAMGKRLCDSHEWEGGCAGALTPPDYKFDLLNDKMNASQKHRVLRRSHNKSRKISWSYGPKKNHSLCGTNSSKGEACNKAMKTGKGAWGSCGSNTFPVGAFPQCKSTLGVYDIHGNAAEHMNLPFKNSELTKNGGSGYTEMKGSWFIFAKYSAHKDDCRWRAPFWHGTKVMSTHSHHNYHLGFRCCKDLK
jgi:formylglycine-generating enzyme required for sulfatase activity